MKIKRSPRLVDMTQYLLSHPHKLVSLTFFVSRYESAKSSISEDLTILKEQFELSGFGRIETVAGAAGGVIYIPTMSKEDAIVEVENLIYQLEAADDRILPGGYFYLTDLLSDPDQLRKIGKIIASYYAESKATAIMTIATKGVPIAQMVALYLNIPFVIVRRDSKVTEGSTVSINYATKGTTRVEKMELTKSSLPQGSHVLVIDDFLNGGGTITGMNSMLKEFNSTCAGIAVLCESDTPDREIDFEYQSLIKVQKDSSFAKGFELTLGTMFRDL